MTPILVAAAVAGVTFVVIDLIWLTLMVGVFYRPQLGDLAAASPRLPAAVLFYLIYIAALVTLVVAPALRAAAPSQALFHGAVFGLAAYATYNLTNLATLTRWPLTLAIVDMSWGALLTAGAAYAAVALTPVIAGRPS